MSLILSMLDAVAGMLNSGLTDGGAMQNATNVVGGAAAAGGMAGAAASAASAGAGAAGAGGSGYPATATPGAAEAQAKAETERREAAERARNPNGLTNAEIAAAQQRIAAGRPASAASTGSGPRGPGVHNGRHDFYSEQDIRDARAVGQKVGEVLGDERAGPKIGLPNAGALAGKFLGPAAADLTELGMRGINAVTAHLPDIPPPPVDPAPFGGYSGASPSGPVMGAGGEVVFPSPEQGVGGYTGVGSDWSGSSPSPSPGSGGSGSGGGGFSSPDGSSGYSSGPNAGQGGATQQAPQYPGYPGYPPGYTP